MLAQVYLLVYAFVIGYAAATLFFAIDRFSQTIGLPEYSRSLLWLQQRRRS